MNNTLSTLLRSSLAVAVFALAATSAQAAFVKTYSGNDCAGVFGQGFENCSYEGSPVIAKYDFDKKLWEINSSMFPTVTGAEWSFGSGSNGTWTYTPGVGDPLITFYVAKGGNFFNLFSSDGDANSGDWYTPTNPNNGKLFGLSHLTFYDTGRPPSEVPEPISLALLGIGLLGMGAARSTRKA